MAVFTLAAASLRAGQWVTYEGKEGAGKGKHIVLISGDEEYRSEEALPMLGKILAERHGFKCTVLFSQNPETGVIDPKNQTNIPGMHHLATADLAIILLRFRELPDADMKYFVDYMQAGKPLIALRTSTHAFNYDRNKQSPYAKYDWRSREWPGGFGQQVLGDTWVNHHGDHAVESARGVIDGMHKNHPILKGVKDIWGPSDVYGITKLLPTDKVLVHGLTLKGMKPDDAPNYNKSLMPMVWLRDYKWENGNTSKILCSTIGAAVDLESADLRRMIVNASFWAIGKESAIDGKANVDYVGEYKPTFFGFDKFKPGVKPADHELK